MGPSDKFKVPVKTDKGPTLDKPKTTEPPIPSWFREALVKMNNDLHLLAENPALGEAYL